MENIESPLFKGKKICFIAGTLGQGGAERQLFYMLHTLSQEGLKVIVLCLTKGEFWEERIKSLGISVIWVGESASRINRLKKIIQNVRLFQPDILQSAHFYTNLYAAICGKILGISAIGALRSDCYSEVVGTGRVFGMLNLKVPRMIAGNSKKGIENAKLMGVPGKRLFLLPNAIDTGQFVFAENRNSTTIKLLLVGSLLELKRIDRFIRAMAQLKKMLPIKIKGIIAGDGPMRSALELQAKNAGLSNDNLQFLGSVTDMPDLYAEADIFVLTSDWEGTPNVVMEAMASGLPVIATNVGGVSNLIEDGITGFLVERENEELLFNTAKRLIEDEALRLAVGKKAREFIQQYHALENLPANLKSLYQLTNKTKSF